MHLRQSERDRTPPRIDIWVCPICGYWRRQKETGVHMDYNGSGPGVRHTLVKAAYIFEGEVETERVPSMVTLCKGEHPWTGERP